MNEQIGVFVAWPYASGDLHLGNVAGAYLPADIFARYHRLRGNRVLMVSGSDTHGTPITLEAARLGVDPLEVYTRFHQRFLRDWQRLGISFDLFTHTDTEHHRAVASRIFRALYDHGLIVPGTTTQLYCETDARFLPDRYVEGTCPNCGYRPARGDQCDNCGRLLDAIDLIRPHCRICGSVPVPRQSRHLFFDLPALQERLAAYVEQRTNWRPNVRNFTLGLIAHGLKPRAATRDLDWGIPVPVDGFQDKVMYVWIEAVMGYLTASMEWARRREDEQAWRAWWQEPGARGYYFVGKDNIPFHALIWPAELMGYDQTLTPPYDVPANEFLTLEGKQFSTSRNWAVWLPDALDRYSPDALRYYLTAVAPETSDTEFTWQGFVDRTNAELAGVWGNLVHRVVTFAVRHWEGVVPAPGRLDSRDTGLLRDVDQAFEGIGALYARVRLKAALREALDLARKVNRYLEESGPWFQIKSDREAAATTIYVALQAIDSLSVLLGPVLPFSSERVRCLLGYDRPLFGSLLVEGDVVTYKPVAEEGKIDQWRASELPSGRQLRQPEVLFFTLDRQVVAEERSRLGVTLMKQGDGTTRS